MDRGLMRRRSAVRGAAPRPVARRQAGTRRRTGIRRRTGTQRPARIRLSRNEKDVPVELIVLAVQLFLITLERHQPFGGAVPRIFRREQLPRLGQRREIVFRPAGLRQDEGRDRKIPRPMDLGHLVGNRIYLRIGVYPEIMDFRRTFVGKPHAFGDREIAARLQVFAPLVQAPLEADVVNRPLGPDQIQLPGAERQEYATAYRKWVSEHGISPNTGTVHQNISNPIRQIQL